MESRLLRPVQLVGRDQVAQIVAAIVGEEHLAGHGMPVEADRVAHPAREDLEPVAVGIHPDDRALEAGDLADVAGRADRDIELAVRSEAGVAPAVVAEIRQHAGRHHDLDLAVRLEADDPVLLGHEETPVRRGQAVGCLQPGGDVQHAFGDAVAVAVEDGVEVGLARADIDLATTVRDRQRARARHLGEHLDREARRQIEALQRRVRATLGGAAGQAEQEGDQTQRHRVLKHQAVTSWVDRFGAAGGGGSIGGRSVQSSRDRPRH